MKIRPHTLWRVPVYCLLSGVVTFLLTAYFGGLFFGVQTSGPDGAILLSIDPVRSALFNGVLFLTVLMIGGFVILRSMTKAEIALSAAIAIGFYLSITLLQILLPNFPLSVSVALAYVQNWSGILSSFLVRLTGQLYLSAILACFAPALFIPFGK